MTNKLAYISNESANKKRELDELEAKYWNTKNSFDAKNAEIENLTIETKQNAKRIFELEQ